MFRLLKPAALFLAGVALVAIVSLVLQSWSIARNSHQDREAHVPYGAAQLSLGVSNARD